MCMHVCMRTSIICVYVIRHCIYASSSKEEWLCRLLCGEINNQSMYVLSLVINVLIEV